MLLGIVKLSHAEVESKVVKILREVFETDGDVKIDRNTTLDQLGYSRADLLNVLFGIEQTFGIKERGLISQREREKLQQNPQLGAMITVGDIVSGIENPWSQAKAVKVAKGIKRRPLRRVVFDEIATDRLAAV